MIFVNDGSGSYTVLEHVTWNGMLPGDLVFPCFMWIMGVCIPIALSAQYKRGLSKFQVGYSILKVFIVRITQYKFRNDIFIFICYNLSFSEKLFSIFHRCCTEHDRNRRAIGKCSHIWSSSTIRDYLFSCWINISLLYEPTAKSCSYRKGMKNTTCFYRPYDKF